MDGKRIPNNVMEDRAAVEPGGKLNTDYVVGPTATMVEQEACFDKTKLPFLTTYAQERQMAQRFDQSLIVEVRLVNVL